LRKRERHVYAAGGRARLAAAGRDRDELPAIDLVGRGRRVARERQRRFPQQPAGRFVERAELSIEVRRADEDEAAGRGDRTAVVLGPCVAVPLLDELRVLAERYLPRVVRRVQLGR